MKIAILGGSFDPPHKGHASIAGKLLKIFHFDEIWLMPLFKHPFDKNLSPSGQRFAMAKLLENDRIKISDAEIKQKKISYTIDTLKVLAKRYPKNEFSWIIGEDQVKDFAKWKNWREMLDKCKLIVIPRTKIKITKKKLKNAIFVDKKTFSPINISSTVIRRKVKEGKSISHLVPKKVEKYIMQNELYK